MTVNVLFSEQFLETLKTVIGMHHVLYRDVPPQGIYFEELVEETFRRIRVPFTPVTPGGTVAADRDLMIGRDKISLKTETGQGTRLDSISITKLSTTERDPWEATALVQHVMGHLGRYEHMLMLRAVWSDRVIHYQVVDIPLTLLRKLGSADYKPVGTRKTRQSIGADVFDDRGVAFHVHFDGSDGKCQIRNLDRGRCNTLREWDYQFRD